MENYQPFYPNSVWQYPAYTQTNPYTGRFAQAQQGAFLPSVGAAQSMPALGKIVDSIEAVRAADIPMDGKTYFFPKADGKEIYGKRWMEDGTTRISKFSSEEAEKGKKEEAESEGASSIGGASEKLMGRFDDIEEKIERIENAMKNMKAGSAKTRKDEGV